MRYSGLALQREKGSKMLETLVEPVARPKAKPEPLPNPDDRERKPLAVQVRGSGAWKQWVDELSEFDERSIATLIERALREYAERVKFPKVPPKR
jgi:hypothetical protein